mmetsp:Transcript_2574/g.5965  ORF Transcript_2574/g.5965 Transcript_2574/m.5965 type:complete len:687 (-) Transcript_2574:39-2099(-)
MAPAIRTTVLLQLLAVAPWVEAALLGHRVRGDTQALRPVDLGQTGVTLPQGLDFTVVQPAPLIEVVVDPASDDAANSVASGGATSLVVSLDLQAGTFHLHLQDQEKEGLMPVAWAKYNNSVSQTGWGFLHVGATDDARVADEAKMYAAGFLEGLATAQSIRDFQHNANILLAKEEERHHALSNIHDVFDKSLHSLCNASGMRSGGRLDASTAPADPWWRQARYALLQSWGMLDGYNRHADKVKGRPMSMVDLMILNSDGETPELEVAYDMEESLLRQSQHDPDSEGESSAADDASPEKMAFLQRGARRKVARSKSRPASQRAASSHEELKRLDDAAWRRIKDSTGRCSALVRLTEGNVDLMVGHTTFSDYSEMTRIFKYYDLPLIGAAVRRMGFSSYPGVAGSTDDYYILDSGLVVTETTISMLTDEPYDKLQDGGSAVPDFMRIMLANRLARSAPAWAELMQQSATGTYSSQWMVVDYNKFSSGEQLQPGTLVVVEQVPGLTHSEDMTARLQSEGYWASENRPWYKDVRDSIGATEAAELHGDLFSADDNPRAKIFKSTAPQVQTLADMRAELQRNRWPNEPAGGPGNTPDHAIAARGDLDQNSPNPNGGVDSKVVGACLAKKLQCAAISGPTHDSQKPFRWTDASGHELFPDAPHDGLPDVWNFDWVRMSEDGQQALEGSDCRP